MHAVIYERPGSSGVLERAIADVTRAVAVGALTEPPTTCFGLADTAAAHDAVEAGTIGKVIVEVGDHT